MSETPTDTYRDARNDLQTWRASMPSDYSSDPHLRLVNTLAVSAEDEQRIRNDASAFASVMVDEVGPLVESYHNRPPELLSWDGTGNRVERINFDGSYHQAGARVWASGMLRDAGTVGKSHDLATKFYLASHEGEMGHMCAVTCTVGMIRVLRRHADPQMCDDYLDRLTSTDYGRAVRGAQFLTEVQGGSDVGANATAAHHQDDDTWILTGEKWFCSVVDAGAFLLLARPESAGPGTRGLACFIMDRHVNGTPNGFSIRRLKDKLGTTSMASGEIDLSGARARVVGRPEDGFKIMVNSMLNSSRWLNAVGDLGIMRRAVLEATGYAAAREAFGQRIGQIPIVRHQLSVMKAEWLAALHSCWSLTGLDERLDLADGRDVAAASEDIAMHRIIVNANKLVCSESATAVVRQGIELLGGNGAIEDFSVLPRLLRDAVVFEQWEGTHNVLAAQALRDVTDEDRWAAVVAQITAQLASVDATLGAPVADRALAAWESLQETVRGCIANPTYGSLHFRGVLGRVLRVHQVGLLLSAAESDHADRSLAQQLRAAATMIVNRHLDPAYQAEHDAQLIATVDAVLGADCE